MLADLAFNRRVLSTANADLQTLNSVVELAPERPNLSVVHLSFHALWEDLVLRK